MLRHKCTRWRTLLRSLSQRHYYATSVGLPTTNSSGNQPQGSNHLQHRCFVSLCKPATVSTTNLSSRSFSHRNNPDDDRSDVRTRGAQRRQDIGANSIDWNRRPERSRQRPSQKNHRRSNRTNDRYRILNQQLKQCHSVASVLDVLEMTTASRNYSTPHHGAKNSTDERMEGTALMELAGGGSMDSINFSTAWHRLAHFHHITGLQQIQRRDQQNPIAQLQQQLDSSGGGFALLSDARFALLVCSTAEALVLGHDNISQKHLWFGPQALSNIAWAIAKLHIITNVSQLKVSDDKLPSGGQTTTNDASTNDSSMSRVVECCSRLRSKVGNALRRDAREIQPSSSNVTWKEDLQELTKILLDTVSNRVLQRQKELQGNQQLAYEHRRSFNSQDSSNLLWALATTQQRHHRDLMQLLVTNMIQCTKEDNLGQLYPQHWANAVWSLATLEMIHEDDGDRSLLPFIASLMSPNNGLFFVTQFKPQELSNLAWGVAKLLLSHIDQHESTPTTAAAKQQIHKQVEAGFQILSIVAEQVIRLQGRNFPAQELNNLCWAISTASSKTSSDKLLPATTSLPQYNHDLWNRLFSECAQQIIERQGRGFTAIDLSSSAWSFATATSSSIINLDETLMNKVLFEISEAYLRIDEKSIQGKDVAILAWACATMKFKHDHLIDYVSKHFITLMQNCVKYQQTTGMLGARCIESTGTSAPGSSSGYAVSTISWALAKLNHGDSFMRVAAPYIVRLCQNNNGGQPTLASIAKTFSRQGLVNLAWACAIEGKTFPEDLIELLFRGLYGVGESLDPIHVCKHYRDPAIHEVEFFPILYLQIAMHLEKQKNAELPSDRLLDLLPSHFPTNWYKLQDLNRPSGSHGEADPRSVQMVKKPSKMQRDVSDAFTRIGFSHVDEYTITMKALARDYNMRVAADPIDVLSVDIANVDAKIGIEVDGPSHYVSLIGPSTNGTSTTNKQCDCDDETIKNRLRWNSQVLEVDGPTRLKHRLLEGLGWNIIHVPYFEWAALRGDKRLEEDYCQTKISCVSTFF